MKIILSVILSAFTMMASAQLFQGTLKMGTAENRAIIAIKCNQNFSSKPSNFQFTLAVPISVGARPVLSIENNNYAANFGNIDNIQTATYGTDYIYLINMAIMQAQDVSYSSDVENIVMEVSFTGNVTASTNIRMVQLPDGLATGGAGGENYNYNFLLEFLGSERTNVTNMFYATNGAAVVNSPLGYLGYASVERGGAIVPVTWLNFNAARSGNNGLLNWEVANQVNNDRFEIEVSKDGSQFSHLGKVVATSTSKYQYVHNNIDRWNVPSLYYRIKQVDKDGNFSYSIVRKLQLNNKALTLTMAENPVRGSTVRAFINATGDGRGTLMVTDMSGKVVYKKQTNWTAGTANYTIDLSGHAAGGYVLSLVSDTENLQVKFVK